ncbi:uncharacterized protein LOC107368371 [Tetranychus urticae]|uniref:uncharacterized protein LOC107368371 n=1 Tax=Tetranychus urticae TaxID=32264 RepID=UPI00077BBA2A|nr:uncharacterized protein LOC107368371 [Tetranychus urticae]
MTLTVVQVAMLINLTFFKMISKVMLNFVILFFSPVLPKPLLESLPTLPPTSPVTYLYYSYEPGLATSWKRKQITFTSNFMTEMAPNTKIRQHEDRTFYADPFVSPDNPLKTIDNPITKPLETLVSFESNGEMLPSSPINNNGIVINQSTVFLGGSCNPTTWRKDIAIPMLKALNITYYDPQKDHWEPELIELEDKAKKNAEVLFFVIDNQTRSIASMIEVSFIAATTKKLVLVIDLFPSLEPIINGEPISQYEHDILKGGRKLLMRLVERKGMPVFNQIPAALNYIPIMIARNAKSRNEANLSFKGTDDRQLSALHMLTSILSSYELIKIKEVYDSCADYSGSLSLLDTKLAYLMLTGKELDETSVQNLLELEASDNITKENYFSNQYNFNHHNVHHNHQQSNLFTSRYLHPNVNRSVDQNVHQNQYHINHNHLNHSHNNHYHSNYHLQTSQKHLNHHNSQPNAHHHNNISNESNLLTMGSSITVNFKQFCTLIFDYLQSTKFTKSTSDGSTPFVNISSSHTPPASPSVNLLTSLVNLPQLDGYNHNYSSKQEDLNGNNCKDTTDSQRTTKAKDIYLAGSDNPKGWRTSIAIPMIDQSNLTYSMPNINSSTDWNITGNDLCSLESCRVLLFVIGGQRPELENMILAPHYFGQKFKVVLCVQPIPTESIAQDNQISIAAIGDYNRGRAYLSEMARKENIEVFENLEEAVKCAIKAAKSCLN